MTSIIARHLLHRWLAGALAAALTVSAAPSSAYALRAGLEGRESDVGDALRAQAIAQPSPVAAAGAEERSYLDILRAPIASSDIVEMAGGRGLNRKSGMFETADHFLEFNAVATRLKINRPQESEDQSLRILIKEGLYGSGLAGESRVLSLDGIGLIGGDHSFYSGYRLRWSNEPRRLAATAIMYEGPSNTLDPLLILKVDRPPDGASLPRMYRWERAQGDAKPSGFAVWVCSVADPIPTAAEITAWRQYRRAWSILEARPNAATRATFDDASTTLVGSLVASHGNAEEALRGFLTLQQAWGLTTGDDEHALIAQRIQRAATGGLEEAGLGYDPSIRNRGARHHPLDLGRQGRHEATDDQARFLRAFIQERILETGRANRDRTMKSYLRYLVGARKGRSEQEADAIGLQRVRERLSVDSFGHLKAFGTASDDGTEHFSLARELIEDAQRALVERRTDADAVERLTEVLFHELNHVLDVRYGRLAAWLRAIRMQWGHSPEKQARWEQHVKEMSAMGRTANVMDGVYAPDPQAPAGGAFLYRYRNHNRAVESFATGQFPYYPSEAEFAAVPIDAAGTPKPWAIYRERVDRFFAHAAGMEEPVILPPGGSDPWWNWKGEGASERPAYVIDRLRVYYTMPVRDFAASLGWTQGSDLVPENRDAIPGYSVVITTVGEWTEEEKRALRARDIAVVEMSGAGLTIEHVIQETLAQWEGRTPEEIGEVYRIGLRAGRLGIYL